MDSRSSRRITVGTRSKTGKSKNGKLVIKRDSKLDTTTLAKQVATQEQEQEEQEKQLREKLAGIQSERKRLREKSMADLAVLVQQEADELAVEKAKADADTKAKKKCTESERSPPPSSGSPQHVLRGQPRTPDGRTPEGIRDLRNQICGARSAVVAEPSAVRMHFLSVLQGELRDSRRDHRYRK